MTTKSETIRARVEPSLKEHAEAIFSSLGLSATGAITLFYQQVVLNEGLPFDVRIPNKETRKALKDARERKNLKTHQSLDEFKQSLGL